MFYLFIMESKYLLHHDRSNFFSKRPNIRHILELTDNNNDMQLRHTSLLHVMKQLEVTSNTRRISYREPMEPFDEG